MSHTWQSVETISIDSLSLDEHDVATSEEAFADLESIIVSRVGTDLSGHVRLLLGVMASAARSAHSEYFKGPTFAYHCHLLGIDHEEVLKKILEKGLCASQKGGRHNFSAAKKDADIILAKYKSGKYTKRALSAEYRIDIRNLNTILGGYELPPKAPIDKASVIRDRENGATFRELSNRYSVGTRVIYKILLDK